MKKLLTLLLALLPALAWAQDTKISNLSSRSTPFSGSDITVFAIPGVSNYKMSWSDLTNDIIAGLASQTYATSAAQAATNGYPWMTLALITGGLGFTPLSGYNITVSNALTATFVLPATNGVSVSGTNVTIDMSVAQAGSLTLPGNVFIRATNSSPMRYYVLELVGTSLVNFETNYTQPTIYGQILSQPTNTAQSRQFVYFQGRVSGNTNNFSQTLVP